MATARKITKVLNNLLNESVKNLGINVTVQLKEVTPKDTTFASINWIASIGQPNIGTAGTRAEAEQGILNTGVQTQALAALRSYKLRQGNINITNNVSYILILNSTATTSAKAPPGFIQTAIVKSIKKTLRQTKIISKNI